MGARTRSDSGRHRSNRGATGSPVRKEASMRRGAVLMVELAPGPHRVSSPTGENESAVSLDALADSIYFVKLWPKMGFFSAHSGMERMDPTEARTGIAGARMVPSTWPGTPMRE